MKRLAALRRPAFDDVTLTSHIFDVTAAVDRELPELIMSPQALLMFGLAGRTAHLRVESRARNAVTTRFPDAGRQHARKGRLSTASTRAGSGRTAKGCCALRWRRASMHGCHAMPAAISATT